MKNRDYMELINGYKTPLGRKEAIFQAIYLIQKECYESALVIIDSYNIQRGELSFFKLKDEDFTKFTEYFKTKRV